MKSCRADRPSRFIHLTLATIEMKRKVIIVLTGIIFFLILFIWELLGAGFAETIGEFLFSESISKKLNGWEYDSGIVANFYFFLTIAFELSIALLLVFILWDFKDKQRQRLLIYFPFLFVILAITSYNYSHADMLIKPGIQGPMNLVLIFLSSVFVVWLYKLKTKSNDLRILKYIFLVLLSLVGVLLPGYFTLIFMFKKLGIGDFEPNLAVVTTICTLISTYIAFKKYKIDELKEKSGQQNL